jgi:CTP synthase (UTP-ammonia lyase)
VNPKYVADFEAAGLKFVGRDVDNERMEVSQCP